MQVESCYQANIPLISNSLTFALRVRILPISIVSIHPITNHWSILLTRQELVKAFYRATGKVSYKLTERQPACKRIFARIQKFPGPGMDSNAIADEKLVKSFKSETVHEQKLERDTDTNSSNTSPDPSVIDGNHKSVETIPRISAVDDSADVSRKRKKSESLDSNIIQVNIGTRKSEDDQATVAYPSQQGSYQQNECSGPVLRRPCGSHTVSEQTSSKGNELSITQSNKTVNNCSGNDTYCDTASVKTNDFHSKHEEKGHTNKECLEQLSENQEIDAYGTDIYIAPEQALVTSVELVVAAPGTSRGSSIPLKQHYDNNLLYNNNTSVDTSADSSNTLVSNDKTDGCAQDSSNLNVRIPILALTTTADRRRAIWAPHDDYDSTQSGVINANVYPKEQQEQQQERLNSADGYGAHIYRNQHETPSTTNPHIPSNILHQIDKETTGTESFDHMIPLQQHHNITQQHFGPQHPTYLQTHLESNMYVQMHQQQHQGIQDPLHQESMHQQQDQHQAYTNYSQRQYSHDQLYGIHHSHGHQSQTQIQCQQQQQGHHLECQAHIQQQQTGYHDLVMDEFREDPSSVYKLTLSPSHPKPENQDDGYETSAGDVLTPNSHSSSTHSGTTQHPMHQGVLGLTPETVVHSKQEEMVSSQNNQIQNVAQADTIAPLSGSPKQTGTRHVEVDPFNFIDSCTSILSMSECRNVNQTTDIYNIKQQQKHHHLNSKSSFKESSHDVETSKHSLEADNSSCCLNAMSVVDPDTLPKRRGRKKKLNGVAQTMQVTHSQQGDSSSTVDANLVDMKPKERKKHDRFNGMSEAEVIKRTIPDHLCDNLDIVIVGINPGLFAAYKGHHYAGPGNHFWKCLYLSGLTEEQMSADDDHTLLKHGIGFTNMVARATKGSADLTRKEIKEGSRILLEKLQRYRPKVAVFNGKLIFEVFSGKKEFHFGRQPDRVEGTDTYVWVMPSSSARCAQLPRAADKVPFYTALKKFRDFLNGLIPHMDETECIFTEQRIRQCCEQQDPLKALNKANSSNMDLPADQKSSLIAGDNTSACNDLGNTECSGQLDYSTNIHNALNRDEFGYVGLEEPLRSSHITGNQAAPVATAISGSNADQHNYIPLYREQQQQPQPEKKKRGRPKKVKSQDFIDAANRTKISISSQQIPQHDFNNILNLSMIGAATGNVQDNNNDDGRLTGCSIVSAGETPTKKKRGRPKKLKPTPENVLSSKQSTNINTNTTPRHQFNPSSSSQSTIGASASIASMHTITMEHTATGSPQNSHHAPPSLYNTPPPSHILYTASASPMASPALNCTYSHSHTPHTPPVTIVDQLVLSDLSKNQSHTIDTSATDSLLPAHQNPSAAGGGVRVGVGNGVAAPHLGETPPPSSPNMCAAVEFEPANHRRLEEQEQQDLAMSQHGSNVVSSPARDSEPHSHSQEHYQHWMISNQHLQSTQRVSTVSHYEQQPQSSEVPLHYQSDTQEHWRYEDQRHGSPYILPSPHPHGHHHHLQQQQHHHHQQQQQHNQHQHNLSPQVGQLTSDMSRKSLSGLESLVDQIPAMREHETSVVSSATAAAAAAAVESRLLGLHQLQQQQQQHHRRCNHESQPQVHPESTLAHTNAVINTNFTVSNLAASSASISNENSTGHNSISSVPQLNTSSDNNTEYARHSPNGYSHHANHLISAAIVAAANSSPHTSPGGQHNIPHSHATPHAHPHAHPQIYMAHMPPVNSMYGPAYGSQHTPSPDYGHSHYGMQAGSTPLHVPSPNYPYGHYSHTAPTQGNINYTGYHHHAHGHTPHHLTVFERLKPSDMSGYSGF
ncbi:uncharacterized protein LOC108607335 isoform X2 [Drosophila busckii]|uniref:uncharacterized protein LOC108607335 isoform X2 n=1 Tax=Drosophila busckii TaxID=30019 RepID=UPI0014329883|nr:uncharacterized protein LOC108607335 isoform X2 [Drosophila busckii]